MNPAVIIVIAVLAIGAFLGGRAFLSGDKSSPLDGSALEVEALKQNANSLRGNEYVVEGTVDEKLRWTPDRGQVVSLKIDTPGGDEFIGIEVPPELSTINIEREQRYAFKVRFRRGGIAVARDISRL